MPSPLKHQDVSNYIETHLGDSLLTVYKNVNQKLKIFIIYLID